MQKLHIDFKKGFISTIILMLFSVVTWADNSPTGFLTDWKNSHGHSLAQNNNEARTKSSSITLQGFYKHATEADKRYLSHFNNIGNVNKPSPRVVSR